MTAGVDGETRVDAIGVDTADIDQDRRAAGDGAAGDAPGIGADRQLPVAEIHVVIVDLAFKRRDRAIERALRAQADFIRPAFLGLALGGERVERRLAAGEPRRKRSAAQVCHVLAQVLLHVDVQLFVRGQVVFRAECG